MEENWDRQEIEKQFKQLQQECESLREKLKAVSSPSSTEKIEHSTEFWTNIWNNCIKKTGPFGSDAIRTMVKSGKMTVFDTDHWGRTLLIDAVNYGAYDLVQFLINNVCDIYTVQICCNIK